VTIYAVGDPEIIDGCTEDYGSQSYQASAGPGGITIVAIYQPEAVPTHIELHAQLESHMYVAGNGADDFAASFGSGALSLSVAGATSYSFPSEFLVPEPDGAALGAWALAALALRMWSARRGVVSSRA
jgi:hypothetical protein